MQHDYKYENYSTWIWILFCFLVKKTSGILFFGTKKKILEVFLTKKAKNMSHRTPLFPTEYEYEKLFNMTYEYEKLFATWIWI